MAYNYTMYSISDDDEEIFYGDCSSVYSCDKKIYIDIKDYNKELHPNFSFDDMIITLMKAHECNKFVHCSFNGVDFYSDNIDFDSAYSKYYGVSYSTFCEYKENKDKLVDKIKENASSVVRNDKFDDFITFLKEKSSKPLVLIAIDQVITDARCIKDGCDYKYGMKKGVRDYTIIEYLFYCDFFKKEIHNYILYKALSDSGIGNNDDLDNDGNRVIK